MCVHLLVEVRGSDTACSPEATHNDLLLLLTLCFALETRPCTETRGLVEAPGTYLALFFWCQGYKCVQPHLASYMGAERELGSSGLHGKYFLPESSSGPLTGVFKGKNPKPDTITLKEHH